MLDLNRLHSQFEGFNAYQSNEQRQRVEKLRRAVDALAACGPGWETLRDACAQAKRDALRAGLLEAPTNRYAVPERPTPLTVVAADGSQIYPDRHVEPHCYLLNVSRIAFQYGTSERPLMEAVPHFHYKRDEYLEEFYKDLNEDLTTKATTEVVSALRDALELENLFDTAVASRIPGRPLVALADGTLIRWMLRRMQNHALEQVLIAQYTGILTRFFEEQVPLCSYISMPGNTEVVNLLRFYLGEHETPTEQTLEGVADRWLFEQTLRPGERSAVFESSSHIQREYADRDRICYFYVRIWGGEATSEVGRVEVPAWVAASPELLDLIHATILSECEKGDGYPMILSEAHEQAVIRARERELFYDLIERNMMTSELRFAASNKATSKRKPLV